MLAAADSNIGPFLLEKDPPSPHSSSANGYGDEETILVGPTGLAKGGACFPLQHAGHAVIPAIVGLYQYEVGPCPCSKRFGEVSGIGYGVNW